MRELALLVYTGGFKPGLLANLMEKLPVGLLDVDYVELKITPNEPRVQGSLKVGIAGNVQQIATDGTIAQQSSIRLRETFSRARVFGSNLDLPPNLIPSRDLFVTFLDEDLFVARDESGVPDIWLRKVPITISSELSSIEGKASEAVVGSVVESEVSSTNAQGPLEAAPEKEEQKDLEKEQDREGGKAGEDAK